MGMPHCGEREEGTDNFSLLYQKYSCLPVTTICIMEKCIAHDLTPNAAVK